MGRSPSGTERIREELSMTKKNRRKVVESHLLKEVTIPQQSDAFSLAKKLDRVIEEQDDKKQVYVKYTPRCTNSDIFYFDTDSGDSSTTNSPLGTPTSQHRTLQDSNDPIGMTILGVIELPEPPSRRVSTNSREPIPDHSQQGVSILLVDDNKINLRIGVKFLSRMGHSVEGTSSGESFYKSFSQKKNGLILFFWI